MQSLYTFPMLLLFAPPLSAPPLHITFTFFLSLNGWKDTYKGRDRRKKREQKAVPQASKEIGNTALEKPSTTA